MPWTPLPRFQQEFINSHYEEIHKKWRKMRAENLCMMRKFKKRRQEFSSTPATAK